MADDTPTHEPSPGRDRTVPDQPGSTGTGTDTDTWAIIAGGGTAGHLLPGLAVARTLVDRGHLVDRYLAGLATEIERAVGPARQSA